jgi:putative hydrolase of the HAD superfamily
VRPEAKAVIASAKRAGCRVGILTNDLERIYGRDIVAKFAVLRGVDVLVDGSWTRIHKPSPEAYTRALAALNHRAEETVFVDDQSRNVDAAMAMGMAGIAFDIRDPASSFRAAERLLGI